MNQRTCGIVTSMSAEIVIRRVKPIENDAVHAFVQAIADETFAHLFASSQVPIGEANWLSAWLALSGEQILGVTMTRDEWVSDLWVRRESRRTGVGGKLLARAEREVRDRGHDTIRLRVVKSNTGLSIFINTTLESSPYEKFGHTMFEMTKTSETLPVS